MPAKIITIIYNARIYTNNPAEQITNAIAIRNGEIIATGNNAENLARTEIHIQRIDLAGSTVLPGLIDSHFHLENYSLSLQQVDCETENIDACLDRVKTRAGQLPNGQWIKGHGWNQNSWPGGFGNAEQLDFVAPDHPVYLTAKSLHAGWANNAALKSAGIHPDTVDPEGGRIFRKADGTPNGILFESAMGLVEKVIPEPSVEELKLAIENAIPRLWQMGLTGVHDFDRRQCFSALQLLNIDKKMKFRVVKSISYENLENAIDLGLRSGFGNEFLSIGPLKLFADGALGPQTAAMNEPFEGLPNNKGMQFLSEEELFYIGTKTVQNGIRLAIHAIGDRANRQVLNSLKQIREYEKAHHLPHLRHRIEHLQILNKNDVPRLKKYGIIASMQPIHATSDMKIVDQFLGFRAQDAYRFKSLIDSGATLTFGSDAPVESPNPLWGIHAAVTRQRHDGSPGKEGWNPAQRITLQQALEGYTINPAFSSGKEGIQGRIAPGFWADLVVFKEDLFRTDPEDLFNLHPIGTMVAGEWVWRSFF